MQLAFAPGEEYSRAQLLQYVGSKQQQTGIIWGPQNREIVICTSGGRHGKRAGYQDGPQPDGTWLYIGQGEKGNQNPESYANRLLIDGQRTTLLFTTREPTTFEVRSRGSYRKMYTFRGPFYLGPWETFTPKEGSRQGDRLLKFSLVPHTSDPLLQPTKPLTSAVTRHRDWYSLRKLLEKASKLAKQGQLSLRTYRLRNAQLKDYAKWRSDGKCEYCVKPAPFLSSKKEPFLEVHHIIRLIDDGVDSPPNVIALCPNCHRRAHYGIDRNDFRKNLSTRAGEIERIIDAR